MEFRIAPMCGVLSEWGAMKIIALLQGGAFEPEDIEIMDQAFTTAAH
jgi:hypothetical protein